MTNRSHKPLQLDPRDPDWDKVIALAWRPAWSIRSRRGVISLLAACWRRWRARR